MKQWTVYFRDKNGSKASVVIEAEDRSGVFAELKKRGISAISVTEGASNKKPRKVAKNSASSKGRGFIAAAVLVLVAGIAAWWMWPEEKVEEPKNKVD
jgi:type II secretory pathway component PulF